SGPESLDHDGVLLEQRDEEGAPLRVVADGGGGLHVRRDRREGAARLTPVHGRALPARDQQAAVRERDEAVEAAARELLHLLLLALVAGDRDAVELLAGEGDHPDAV